MRSLKVAISGTILLLVSACSGQEQQVLNTFFSAVQSGDDSVVSNVSLVPFTGSVKSWEILEVGPETQAPFALPELNAEISEARSELRIQTQKNSNFAGDNRALFDEYKEKKLEDPDYEFSGELAGFQVEWEERMAQQGVLEKAVAELEEQARLLRSAAGLSLSTSVNDDFAGDVTEKELKLKVNDGSLDKNYTVKLERYELGDTARNIRPIARWIIADIKEQA